MKKTEQTEQNTKIDLSETDWAWTLPQRFNLEHSGALLVSMLDKIFPGAGTAQLVKFQDFSNVSKTFDLKSDGAGGKERICVWVPKFQVIAPDTETNTDPATELGQYGQNPGRPVAQGRFTVGVVPVEKKDTLEGCKFNRIPMIYIETPEYPLDLKNPDGSPAEPISPEAEDTVKDDLTAGELASIVANALNLYLELAVQYKSDVLAKKKAGKDPKASPFATSWSFLETCIVPKLRAQIEKEFNDKLGPAEEPQPEKPAPPNLLEREEIESSRRKHASMLRCLSELVAIEAAKIEQDLIQ